MSYLQLDSVSLTFPRANRIRGLVPGFRKRTEPVPALQDVSLRLKEGDRVALIGRNGAGKSTLLRVMADIFPPTRGRVHSRGSIVTFFGKSVGVYPELNGLDNIYLRGLFLGHRPRDIVNRFLPDIVDSIDLGDALYQPFRTYSAGMKARLTFGLHLFAQGDIFLIDEALGAGDAAFIERARAIARRILSRGSIIVFASHSIQLLKKFCSAGLILDRGRVVFLGNLDEAIKLYNREVGFPASTQPPEEP